MCRPLRWFPILCALALGVSNCQCDQGLQAAAPEIGLHALGHDRDPPDPSSFTATPEDRIIRVDFGAVSIGSVATRYLFLRNTGKSVLALSEIQPDPEFSSKLFYACPQSGLFVDGCGGLAREALLADPGQDLVLQLRYAPADVLVSRGRLILTVNSSEGDVLIELSGQGMLKALGVCVRDCIGSGIDPACAGADWICDDDLLPGHDLGVDFGIANPDAVLSRQVKLVNVGQQTIQVSGIGLSGSDSAQFAWVSSGSDLPGMLASGAEALIEVSYHPATGGLHAGVLLIQADVGSASVDLAGRLHAPRVCPDPISVDFGVLEAGQQDLRTIQVVNCGAATLNLFDVSLAPGTSSDFQLSDLPGLPSLIDPGSSIQLDVRYTPGQHGSDSGGVQIFSDDPSSDPQSGLTGSIALTGSGMVRACEIQATPFAIQFGAVEVGQQWEQDLWIVNQGTDDCSLESLEITLNTASDEFYVAQAPQTPVDFFPGDTLLVQVGYAPSQEGSDVGELTLTGTDQDGPTIPVQLAGQGVAEASCDLMLAPSRLSFGTVEPDHSRSLALLLTNQGPATCSLEAPELLSGGLGPVDFSLTVGPAGPFQLARRGEPGDQVMMEVTFSPQAEGDQTGILWLHTDDDPDFLVGFGSCARPGWPPVSPGAGDACIALTGQSAESDLEVVPSDLDFGLVTVGCSAPELQVTVYNTGYFTVQVEAISLADAADHQFEIRQAPATPFSLGWSEQFQVVLRYVPQADGLHSNTLVIETDDFDVPVFNVPISGQGTSAVQQTDLFTQTAAAAADVLFVVDNSESMSEEQDALAQNFQHFIQWALSLQTDFQIGVITTMPTGDAWYQGEPPRDIVAGELTAAPGRPEILTPDTPQLVDAFSENVHVGTCACAGTEAGLQAAHKALTPPEVADANAGFLRDDARLYLIMVSDEDDQSTETVDFYVDFFAALKGPRNTSRMVISAVVGDSPDGCDGPGGAALPGGRYIQAAQDSGGVVESICTANWAQTLENIGLDAFAGFRDFPLSRPAVPGSVHVRVDGSTQPEASCGACGDGWTFYPDSNSIYFGEQIIPAQGALIEIDYTAACL